MAGNKCDMNEQREVSEEEAMLFAEDQGIMFYEISALNGQNIQAMFNDIAKKLTGIETDLIKPNKNIANG